MPGIWSPVVIFAMYHTRISFIFSLVLVGVPLDIALLSKHICGDTKKRDSRWMFESRLLRAAWPELGIEEETHMIEGQIVKLFHKVAQSVRQGQDELGVDEI